MHPLFDPRAETRLWPYGQREVYETFDRIFDCRGHGWSNLQSTHLNLPFDGDDEFGRLHAAVRLILPLLPALAASSPFVEGRATGTLDNRLAHYRQNCARVPSVTGHVVPERVFTEADYEREILGRIARDLAPLDPAGHLESIWTNARGAIARFDRGAIEIRVLDVQETPAADLAILAFVVELAKALVSERLAPYALQREFDERRLDAIFRRTTERGMRACIDDAEYLRALGARGVPSDARALFGELLEALPGVPAVHRPALELILEEGNLAERLITRLGPLPAEGALLETYAELAALLPEGRLFMP
jgi:glutamate---cysteine ligase / carboxylate-amine ligase